MKDTSENREKRQRESYAEECRVWAHKNREAIASLKAKLFAIGGNKISPQPCPFVSEIASHGVLVELPVKLRQMDGNRCHHNVASFWEQRKKHSRLKAIATGYALSEDRMWRWHTWGLAATNILEATVVRSGFNTSGYPWTLKTRTLLQLVFCVRLRRNSRPS